MNKITRAPKQLGDFGEGLVNYLLIRKGHEVAKVDHVGADLISACSGKRYAISVKTRMFKRGTKESRTYTIEDNHLEKLKHYSKLFNLTPLFSFAVCLVDEKSIYVFIMPVDNIDTILKKVQNGYSLNFSKKQIAEMKSKNIIDISCWENEDIGDKTFDI
jgi:hypothetical protein